jgi:hypothetical protein
MQWIADDFLGESPKRNDRMQKVMQKINKEEGNLV